MKEILHSHWEAMEKFIIKYIIMRLLKKYFYFIIFIPNESLVSF